MSDQYYSFLPHVRQGLANGLENLDENDEALDIRPKVKLDFKLKGDEVGGNSDQEIATYEKEIQLYGPGDIVGINKNAIIRTAPLNWITNFEYNFLPYIEFYEEDFPWRYSPEKVDGIGINQKLPPWMALVVLKETEFEKVEEPNGVLPSFKLKAPATALTVFPDHEQLWAWAHVHVNDNLGTNAVAPSDDVPNAISYLDGILDTNPNKAVSRIMCPRKLEKNEGYYAFLIPAYMHGVNAGLGKPLDSGHDVLTPAWSNASGFTNVDEFPIYHEWFFKTSNTGDFESLVEDLKPVQLTADSLGTRELDIQNPNDTSFIGTVTPDDSSVVELGGALRTLDFDPDSDNSWDVANATNYTPPTPPTDPSTHYLHRLSERLNTPFKVKDATPTEDPIVSPPLYGRWHAKKEKIETSNPTDNWFTRANMDPRFRVFAGAGAEVVKKHQETFMDICWNQVEKVVEANKKLRQMKLAEQASNSLYQRSISSHNDDGILTLTNSVHDRVKNGTQTVYADVAESLIPTAAVTGAYRRITRKGGTLVQTLSLSSTPFDSTNILSNFNAGTVQVAPPYAVGTGVHVLNPMVLQTCTSMWLTSQPPRNNFYLTVPTGPFYSPGIGTNNNLVAHNFITAGAAIVDVLTVPYAPLSTGTTINMASVASSLVTALNPYSSILAVANNIIDYIDNNNTVQVLANLNEILATPKIELPMARYLYEVSPELLIPGINSIPQNSVSTLGIDQRYVEAYMLGLNHEIMSELLWREYPTDQRGTVFSRFWGSMKNTNASPADTDKARAIKPIHQWSSGLKDNYHPGGVNPKDLTILCVRGELLKKYPNTLIYANKAQWQQTGGQDDPTKNRVLGTEIQEPVFFTQIADIAFFGFDLDKATARGSIEAPTAEGWFFVFKEIVGEVSYGLDIGMNSPPSGNQYDNWDSVDWVSFAGDFITCQLNQITSIAQDPSMESILWGQNAADMAHITYRKPSMVVYHALNLIMDEV